MATADMTRNVPPASSWDLESPEAFDEDGSDGDGFTAADVFVAVAITLASATLTLALIIQTGTPIIAAVLTGGCVWIAMLIGHTALRRVDGGSNDRRGRNAPQDHGIDDKFAGAGAEPFARRDVPGKSPPGAALDRGPAPGGSSDGEPAFSATLAAWREIEAGDALAKGRGSARAAPAASDDDGAWLGDLDLGDFRPKAAPELPAAARTSAPAAKPAIGGGSLAGVEDSQNIEAMLRRLAADISRGRKTADSVVRSAGAGRADAGPASRPKPPPLPPMSPPIQAGATTMPPAPKPVRVETAAGRLAVIADALSDEQIEVFLETINGLDDYRARHYEVSVRLKLRDGETLDNEKLMSETRGSGLLPLIEAVKVSSARRVAVQMIRRGRTGDFFALVDGEALETRQFGADMETIIGDDQALAARLVLAFSQADLRGFTTAQWVSLREIADLGFRFSIEEITDLDMDFEKLASNGFAFAKLDADVFLKGLPIENSRVPAADICRHLSGAGLALIVGNISDETTRAKILGFGALFGQGALFGAPRPVRPDVLRQREPAAAAR